MKTKLLIFLFFILASFRIAAQHKPDLVKYYSAGIDSLVAQSRVVNEDYEEEKTNPAYARLMPPLSSIVMCLKRLLLPMPETGMPPVVSLWSLTASAKQ